MPIDAGSAEMYFEDGQGTETDHQTLDSNSDGIVNTPDCPYEHGTPKAKVWWKQTIEPYIKTQITPEMKAKYGSKCVGAYEGRALVPGEAGWNQGDFNFLVDKLRVTRGLDLQGATKIAGKITNTLYGG